jgi:hypothetical protein
VLGVFAMMFQTLYEAFRNCQRKSSYLRGVSRQSPSRARSGGPFQEGAEDSTCGQNGLISIETVRQKSGSQASRHLPRKGTILSASLDGAQALEELDEWDDFIEGR